MTTQEFVNATILKATGKRTILATGSTKYEKILGIGNTNIEIWQDEEEVDWDSLYDPSLSFGTVTATDSFDVPATVRKISDARGDKVRILHTDGVTYSDYQTVPGYALQRYPGERVCAVIAGNLVFEKAFVSTDPQFGGTILVPVYTYAPLLVADEDTPGAGETNTVPVDIPNWLVLASAAEYIRNDITKQNQFGNLIDQTNKLMARMKEDNDAQITEPDMPWGAAGSTWN